ncbi:DUF72 domain-containing protein [Bacillus sp. CGMCC 1.16607]|uniref:DUF72 domain-containing protein n=1 Tax=Bacillus sp. CGMCC 1.16607 TaxID=3351842 RepID=UPI003635204F
MIFVGVTGWGDHNTLYPGKISPRDRLSVYAAHFPIVEVDTSFYAIQPVKNAEKWVLETPDSFQFVVKAYQGMTGHQREGIPFENKKEMFKAFKESIQPYLTHQKLAMVLFQFPPWFDCKKDHVEYLRFCKKEMGEIPCALEFRHQSWFYPELKMKTLDFMRTEGWIHTICDEPQAGQGSVPVVLASTQSDSALVRFHGRNVHGWQKQKGIDWREVRYLYRYNQTELAEWAVKIRYLHESCRNIYVLFNNNSGGDAADNAKEFIQLLNIEYTNLAPRQLDLF